MLVGRQEGHIISIIHTVNGTEWPYMCWSAVKNLLTHSRRESGL